ncbi:hypothetical protein LSTR_LSTR001799 [Laodelphax striatellus]|uniref:Uncharacterized protein n=1 Tax=Laodelphax striatellus TaxID=195883 RepID=A0A482WFL6_LAOST|nr:hypothetical protein LSTR_LSTR001799 [Laodelphax striatellus]
MLSSSERGGEGLPPPPPLQKGSHNQVTIITATAKVTSRHLGPRYHSRTVQYRQ